MPRSRGIFLYFKLLSNTPLTLYLSKFIKENSHYRINLHLLIPWELITLM